MWGRCLGDTDLYAGFAPRPVNTRSSSFEVHPGYAHRSGSAESPLIGAFAAPSVDTPRSSRVCSLGIRLSAEVLGSS